MNKPQSRDSIQVQATSPNCLFANGQNMTPNEMKLLAGVSVESFLTVKYGSFFDKIG